MMHFCCILLHKVMLGHQFQKPYHTTNISFAQLDRFGKPKKKSEDDDEDSPMVYNIEDDLEMMVCNF